jgi:hypothetical protein
VLLPLAVRVEQDVAVEQDHERRQARSSSSSLIVVRTHKRLVQQFDPGSHHVRDISVEIRASTAAAGVGRDTVGRMDQRHPLVTPADRTALLRHGIVVLEVDPARMRIDVTGHDPERARDVTARRLGDGVDVDVLGELPRTLVPRPCVGYMEREPGRLQLRIVLRGDEHVDEILVAEDERAVVAFATVCTSTAGETGPRCEVPCHVYLDRPLGERAVIDGTLSREVPYKNIYPELEAEGG